MSDVALALVLLTPIGGGLLVWPAKGRLADGGAVIAALMTLLSAGAVALTALGGSTVTGLGMLVSVDALGGLVLLVVCIVSAVTVAGSFRYLRHAEVGTHDRPLRRGRYWALLLWFIGALLAVPLMDNLGLVWVGIEAGTIVSAMLVGFSRTPEAIEAAWKALILGSVGIGFALLGTMLAYASSVHVLGEAGDALAWTRLDTIASQLDPGLMRLSFIFVLVGYGTKTGLVPFHTWLPDAHSQAPSPVSALLSGASLAVALYALARFQTITAAAIGPSLPSTLLVVFGLLSLTIALPFIVAQDDLKRLLAYSSIEHMGVAALALGFGGAIALGGLVLHLVGHGLVKSSLFLVGGGIVETGDSRRILMLSGSLRRAPTDGWGFLAGALLLSGLPPSVLFVSELAVVVGGVQQGWGVAAALAALLLALATAGLLFHVARVAWGRPRGRSRHAPPIVGEPHVPRSTRPRPAVAWSLVIAPPLVLAAVLGVWLPTPLAAAVERVVTVLGVTGG